MRDLEMKINLHANDHKNKEIMLKYLDNKKDYLYHYDKKFCYNVIED